MEKLKDRIKKWVEANRFVVWVVAISFAVGTVLGFGGCYYWVNASKDEKVEGEKVGVEAFGENGEKQGGRKYLIDLRGAIENPGVYEIEEGSIVDQLIVLAGGLKKNADIDWTDKNLNYARDLEDREKIYIPYKENVVKVAENVAVKAINVNEKININTASQAELEELSGVGPSTAKKIIDGRPYKRIEDIMNVKGIGEATFNKIKDRIEV